MPFPPPEDLPDPGIEPKSPALAGRFFNTGPPGKTSGTVKVVLFGAAPAKWKLIVISN